MKKSNDDEYFPTFFLNKNSQRERLSDLNTQRTKKFKRIFEAKNEPPLLGI